MDKINKCRNGSIILIVFCVLTLIAVALTLPGYFGAYVSWGIGGIKDNTWFWVILTLAEVGLLSILFWIGIITVYIYSSQLAIKTRVLGIVFGWVPIANVIMLTIIIRKSLSEAIVEKKKIKLNEARKKDKICATKYPILLVHGVFFRDFEHLNYWGRVPGQLEANGATIYYGNHNSASAVADSALELEKRIKEIIETTGCEKVNVIAHSKGGLDTRYAISQTSVGENKYVASLTTINTPHRGCEFADFLLDKIPESKQLFIAKNYNTAAAALGDTDPDFIAAVNDLTHDKCTKRNEFVKDDPDVYYQSYGSMISRCRAGRFPLNMSYLFVKFFDGDNDGLVGEKSFEWGSKYTFLKPTGKRGISHADMIDLNRENYKGFDVREFYVQLVADLKNKGF